VDQSTPSDLGDTPPEDPRKPPEATEKPEEGPDLRPLDTRQAPPGAMSLGKDAGPQPRLAVAKDGGGEQPLDRRREEMNERRAAAKQARQLEWQERPQTPQYIAGKSFAPPPSTPPSPSAPLPSHHTCLAPWQDMFTLDHMG